MQLKSLWVGVGRAEDKAGGDVHLPLDQLWGAREGVWQDCDAREPGERPLLPAWRAERRQPERASHLPWSQCELGCELCCRYR